jgi:putative ABC transport system substrate-binding protein
MLASALFALPVIIRAQSGPKRIGFLSPYSRAASQSFRDAFVDGLRVLGYADGKDFVLVERFADGRDELLPNLASQLVALRVDLLFVATTNVTAAAQQATAETPIVFYSVSDPVRAGFADNISHPCHNLTGLTNLSGGLIGKRLELLKQMVPRLERVSVLANPANPYYSTQLERTQPAADRLGLTLFLTSAQTREELETAFRTMVEQRIGAVVVSADVDFYSRVKEISDLALRHRLPSMFPFATAIDAGALMSYGVDEEYAVRHAATYVDKIFKGAKPADLPIEQPTKIDLIINGKTARALRLVIPAVVRMQAVRVIE